MFVNISGQACLTISEEQEDFLQHILTIPLEEGSWKNLVTLDSLHAFCGGLIMTYKARHLDGQSRLHKFFFPCQLILFVCIGIRFVSLLTCGASKMELGKKKALEVKKAAAIRA